jgi:hypothetical protein
VSADGLRKVREQIESGQFTLTPDAQRAVLARTGDLIDAVEAAGRALSTVPLQTVPEAAAKIVYLFYLSGHGWRRLLAASAESASAGAAIQAALQASMSLLVPQLAHALATRTTALVKQGNATWSLTCAVCDGDAVTFTRTRTGPQAPEQLVTTSLSPVTEFRSITGPRMADLIALLEAGDVPTLVRHMVETQPAGCDAWCSTCSRVYCRDHTAIEAQWSGSWHEATYATCPLGHERVIE